MSSKAPTQKTKSSPNSADSHKDNQELIAESSMSFDDFGFDPRLAKQIARVGYETPTPIQAAAIPPVMAGGDIIGVAQTGTGKTAAFALPILSKIDIKNKDVQALIICPTRELAIQVAEAFQQYGQAFKGFQVAPIYGGQEMRGQLRMLSRGCQVVVGTPGRLLDHLNRKSLRIEKLKMFVLDEADEMLRMGFIDDVENILSKAPDERQIALFSATMPPRIRQVADRYLNKPTEIKIEAKVSTNENIEQFYWTVSARNKLASLTRILEVEEFDGMIIFVRTKTATSELADRLSARGYNAAALNGDLSQQIRQRMIDSLKKGRTDILVCTDVAARGIDVERISHVINYDIPYDEEAYVHRIGRTGRAGRSGRAVLFVTPRERHLLKSIQRTIRLTIPPFPMPSQDDLADMRRDQLKARVKNAVENMDRDYFRKLTVEAAAEFELSVEDVAAASLYLLQEQKPLRDTKAEHIAEERFAPERDGSRGQGRSRFEKRGDRQGRRSESHSERGSGKMRPVGEGMERFKINVGRQDGVKPGEIVGAIANEAGIGGKLIGHIKILEEFSTVDLPEGMPKETVQILQKTRVRQRPLRIQPFDGSLSEAGGDEKREARRRPPREGDKPDYAPKRAKGDKFEKARQSDKKDKKKKQKKPLSD